MMMYERLSMERVVVLLLAVVRRQQRHSRSAAEEVRGGEATLLLLLLLLLLVLASLKRSKMVVVLCAGQPMVRSYLLTLHSHVVLLVAEEVALEWVLRRRLELVPWQLQVRQAEEAVVCEHQPLQPQAQQV